MTTPDLPQWLKAAREAVTPRISEFDSDDLADVCPGDIWTAVDSTGSLCRMVLVLNAEGCTLDVALLSPDTDWAGDRDLVLHPEDTTSPYSLMVETALTGQIHWAQVRRRVGAIDDSLLDDILDFIWEERPAALDVRRGFAATRINREERTRFEREELAEFGRLTKASDSGTKTVNAEAISRQPTPERCLELLRDLRDPSTVVWEGAATMAGPPPTTNVQSTFGMDIAQLHVRSLLGRCLLNGGVVRRLHGLDESVHVGIWTANVDEAPWLEMDIEGEPLDGPVGFVDETPIFVSSEKQRF